MSIQSTLLVIFVATLFTTQSLAQSTIPTEATFFYKVCDSAYGNYTSKSTYASNLTTVLTSLQKQSSASLFYNASAGEVYGQYYCRGDVGSALCSACISQASELALTSCPNFKSAIIWYDLCSLRYRNESMFGVPDFSWVSYDWSFDNVSNPSSFSDILNSTLDTLIKEAARGNDFRSLAVANVAVSAFETTYFLVQCSPDLSDAECETCLLRTDDWVQRCCGNWPVSASVFFPNCQMRYSNLLFYTAPPTLPPPPPTDILPPPPQPSGFLSPPPVTTSSPTDGTKKASSEKVKVGIAVIFLALLTFQL